ncbi:chemotaxis protein [Anaerocolumna aminovalerica]|uniref:Stage 0 sporulation protein A homolog n=1 Tax=Anaerocolumna aminovalerica TaxID=1527 RepID=A0A1I5HAB2_9FIRM|nr:chemotaxis protein [Anaerocolumna aminovalerica]MDU6266760.1 chemotaxis protein [Anaerocolumna aminovalerica]SFO45232.1 two-component system, chemotaxis family, response regulator CheV [Anaerocolumna aminovalerica]
MDTGILLESGTNELEILEFKVGENYYGINVAKIREILPYQKPTIVPNAHPFIEGIFMPRDMVISVIDLAKCMHLPESENRSSDMFVVTNFNKLNVAFHVHSVVGIHRVSWQDINKPDETISTGKNGIATGIIKKDKKLIIILDFEKIISDINPETGLKISDVDHLGVRKRNDSPILIAEDSPLLNNLIINCLTKAGYTNIINTANGQEAWNKLLKFKEDNSVDRSIKCVITDIEMPQMDGHHLTKLIKDDAELKHLPVIIFSSLINDDMKRKGELLGADAQLTKPEIGTLVDAIDRLILH